jgi:undecaprenyl diphosphate synthase
MPTGSAEMHERHPAKYTDNGNQRLPRHVAIMTDGNGRWGLRHGWPRGRGHEVGADNVRAIVLAALDLGIEYLTLFVFSTENWRRPTDEVRNMLRIVHEHILPETEVLHRAGVRIKLIGDLADLRIDPAFAKAARAAIHRTRGNIRMTLTLAINYGGRADLLQAIQRILRDRLDPDTVDEVIVNRYLYTAELPDPDLIIRPSGEFRLSNFLLWQGAGADFSVMNILWPDFRPEHLCAAVRDYQRRRSCERGGDDILDGTDADRSGPIGQREIVRTPHLVQEPTHLEESAP